MEISELLGAELPMSYTLPGTDISNRALTFAEQMASGMRSGALTLAEQMATNVPVYDFVQREMDRVTAIQGSLFPYELLHQFTDYSTELQRTITTELESVQRAIQSYVDPLLEPWRRDAEMFYNQQSELHQWLDQYSCDDLFPGLDNFLIHQGWYLSNDLPAGIVFQLSDWFDENKLDTIEQQLCAYYRHRAPEIERNLVKCFPKRERLLTAAFRAHSTQDYALSVPAFLTQVDGISRDLWRANFFCAGQSNRSISRLVRDGRVPPLSPTLRRQLFERGSIRASSNQNTAGYRFNRHDILHGNDTEFDREEYSLRCIALLDFMLSLSPLFEAN